MALFERPVAEHLRTCGRSSMISKRSVASARECSGETDAHYGPSKVCSIKAGSS
jgi:hypothetical protein